MGRALWAILELYDKWLQGGGLEVDERDEYFIEDGEAGRVTWLLSLVLPPYFAREDEPRVDASRPAADQAHGFVALGWNKPPRAGELLRRMVEYVEDSWRWYARVDERPRALARTGGRRRLAATRATLTPPTTHCATFMKSRMRLSWVR